MCPAPQDPRGDASDDGREARFELTSLTGGEVVAADLCAVTGLVSVLVRCQGETRALGVGLGPHAVGMGWLPRRAAGRAPRTHPLAAALRAHVVGRSLAAARLEPDGVIALLLAGQPAVEVRLRPGRRGEAVVETGASTVRWPLRSAGADEPRAHPDASRRAASGDDLSVAGAALLERSDAAVVAAERVTLRRSIVARRDAVARRVLAIRGDLERLQSADEIERVARLLVAQAAKVPRGARRATLDDWERGGALDVDLDPARPARAQAEAMFAKVRRWRRGRPIVERRLAAALEELSAAERAVEAASSDVPLEDLCRRAVEIRARAGGAGTGASDERQRDRLVALRSARAGERRPFQVFRASGERAVLVGRGAADNDALTTRHARPHDLWLHAKGRGGAHVVVPLDKGEDCPSDLLVDAATLAAHFSDARAEPICEVSYVMRRYVRKRKGSPAGAVVVDREKVMTLRLEPVRLQRLLAARED
jgi:hypothetical protein